MKLVRVAIAVVVLAGCARLSSNQGEADTAGAGIDLWSTYLVAVSPDGHFVSVGRLDARTGASDAVVGVVGDRVVEWGTPVGSSAGVAAVAVSGAGEAVVGVGGGRSGSLLTIDAAGEQASVGVVDEIVDVGIWDEPGVGEFVVGTPTAVTVVDRDGTRLASWDAPADWAVADVQSCDDGVLVVLWNPLLAEASLRSFDRSLRPVKERWLGGKRIFGLQAITCDELFVDVASVGEDDRAFELWRDGEVVGRWLGKFPDVVVGVFDEAHGCRLVVRDSAELQPCTSVEDG